MKKLFFSIAIVAALIPAAAFATPVSWDKTTNLLQPLPTSYSDEVRVPYITATSTTATSTLNKTKIVGPGVSILGEYFTNLTTYVRSLFSNGTGLNYSGGAFSLANTAVSPGSYTNANITVDQQGRITLASSGSAGGSGTVATSSSETAGQLAYWTTTSGTPAKLGKIATTTITFSGPFSGYSSLGTLVGGSNSTIGWTGLATTSQPSSSNLLVSNGGAGVYGVATSTLTASGPLTGSFTQIGSGGSLGCTTAASGVAGCLSNTAFDTFNNKQAAISATWPITLSGATLGFNGLSTSTAAVIGNIPYFSGVNTFANVATSTITLGTGFSYSGTLGSLVGGASGSLTLSGIANASLANSTISGVALGGTLFGLSATNGSLTFSGTYTGAAAQTIGLNLANANSWTALQSFTNASSTLSSVFSKFYAGGTATTTIDSAGNTVIGGTFTSTAGLNTLTNASTTNITASNELVIPNGSSKGSTVAGQTELDTTDNQLKIGDGSATAIFDPIRQYSFGYATSTWTGTTTKAAAPFKKAGTIKNLICTTTGGTVDIDWYYGPTPTHLKFMAGASTTPGIYTFSSSNTPAALASSTVAIGNPSGTPTQVACTADYAISGT